MVSFYLALKSVACPVEILPARENNQGRLIEHFMYWHWKAKGAIIHEGPEPLSRYDHCGMHMIVARLIKHIQTAK